MKLSTIILCGNDETLILDCLKNIDFSDEIIVVAANSTDNSKKIIKKFDNNIKIIESNDDYGKHFSKWRNMGYKAAKGEWLLYIDTDERITPGLKEEIISTINSKEKYTHYAVPRANFFLGKRVKSGGTYPDYQKRLFSKKNFTGYKGVLHEEAQTTGDISYLKNDLQHYTHRDLTSMLKKTIIWTELEAKALYDSNHPPVVWWRFIRMMLTKFWERLIIQKMWKDGIVGWISVIFEMFDTFIIYARLWELQQRPKN